MDYIALDRYLDRDSLLHRLDPRTKLLFALLFVLLVVLSPPASWIAFGGYLAVISAIILTSGISYWTRLRRSLAVVPLVLIVGVFLPFFGEGEIAYTWQAGPFRADLTAGGILALITMIVKACLSMFALAWLTAVTRFTSLLQAMERLHVPAVMIMIVSFMYRYLFVIVDEALTMKRARDSRSPGGTRLREIRSLGGIIGTLFIRSYERSERVYASMVARGFDGKRRTISNLTLKRPDIIFSSSACLLLTSIAVYNVLVLAR